MRIDPKTTTVTPVSAKPVRDAAAPKAERKDENSATVVELSSAGAAAGSAMVDSSSGASSEKLSRLRAMIDKGEYQPDLDLLSRRIVEDDLLGDAT